MERSDSVPSSPSLEWSKAWWPRSGSEVRGPRSVPVCWQLEGAVRVRPQQFVQGVVRGWGWGVVPGCPAGLSLAAELPALLELILLIS